MLRLLKKQEIAAAKANDRRKEIEEGLKVAKRVDSLREIAAQEEASLTKFREKMIAEITDEINQKTYERDALKQEVVLLQNQRRVALEPLDNQEKELEARALEVTQKEEALSVRMTLIERKEIEAQAREKRASEAERQASYTQADARDRLHIASTIKDEAERTLRIANDTLLKAQIKSQKITKEQEERDSFLAKREAKISAKEEELRQKELELAREHTRLRDREEILKRNLKRNGTSIT